MEPADFKALLESHSDWIWETDARGICRYASIAVTPLLGYTPGEMVGRHLFSLIHDNAAEACQHFFDALESASVPPLELEMLQRNGQPRTVEIEVSGFSDNSGALAGYRGRCRDISRRVQQRRQFLSAQKLGHMGIWELDLKTDRQKWSDGVFHLLREEPQSFDPTFERFMEFLPERDRFLVQQAMHEAFERRGSYELFHDVVLKDGTVRNVHTRADIIYQGAHPLRMLGSVVDVTDQRALQQQLQNTVQILNGVIDNVDNLIFYKDTDYRYMGCNRAFEAFVGQTRDALVGRDDFDFFTPDAAEHFRALDRKIFETGERVVNAQWVTYADGREVYLHTVTTPFYDREGCVVGLVGNSIDLTDEKRLNDQLEHQARFDSLTDTPNRLLFSDRLGQAIHRAQRYGTQIAVFYMDLDGFKQINDTMGHHFGDLLLKEVARRLQHVVRKSDTVARLGGDEFAAILTDLRNSAPVFAIAQKLIDAVKRPLTVEEQTVQVTLSVGISLYPDHGSCADTLLNGADMAMYESKKGGKNRFSLLET